MEKKRQPQREAPKDLGYYLTLFKLEGHTTWRAHLSGGKDDFEKQKQATWPKVTEKNVIRIDRIAGTLQPL